MGSVTGTLPTDSSEIVKFAETELLATTSDTPSLENPSQEGPLASISGHILDQLTGRGVEGVSINVVPHRWTPEYVNRDKFGPPVATTQTNAEGSFMVAGLEAGDYRLGLGPAAGYPRYDVFRCPIVQVASGENVSGLEIVLDRGLTAKGRVLNTEGQPIGGAQVTVWHDGEKPHEVCTDALGRFAEYGFAPNSLPVLRVEKKGYRTFKPNPSTPAFNNIVGHDGVDDLEFVLERAGYIAGVLVDEQGNALDDVRVTARGDVYTGRDEASGAGGEWAVLGLQPDTYSLEIDTGYGRRLTEKWEISGEQRCFTIAGIEGIDGVRLVAKRVDTADDANGEPRHLKDLEELREEAIRGHIRDQAGRPVTDATIFHSGSSETVWSAVESDEKGFFELIPMYRDSIYELYLGHADFSITGPIAVPARSQNAELVLDPLSLVTGRVLNAETGEPICAFAVKIEQQRNMSSPRLWDQVIYPEERLQRFVDPEGVFTIPSHFPGVITISVAVAGYVQKDAIYTVNDALNGLKLEFAVDRGRRIGGVVTDATGRPIENVEVWAWGKARTMTDVNGRFRFECLPPDVYTIITDHNWFGQEQQIADLSEKRETHLRFSLTPAGCVEGKVTCGGTVIKGADIGVKVPRNSLPFRDFIQSGEDGGYVLRGLNSGTHRITCAYYGPQQSFKLGPVVVNVEAGKSVRCDFDCDSPYLETEGECVEGEMEGQGAM